MRITNILLRKNYLPHGNIWRGKDKLIKQVTPVACTQAKRELAIEENNMLLLKFPYLTEEQSRGHASALGKRDQFWQKWITITRSHYKPHVKLEDRLAHLKVSENWE